MLLLPAFPAAGSARSAASLYSVSSNAPKVSEVCDLDGSKLAVRDDDREEVVRERLRAYEQQTDAGAGVFPEVRNSAAGMCTAAESSALRRAIAKGIRGGAEPDTAMRRRSGMIVRKNMAELEKMRAAGLLVWKILDKLKTHGRRGRIDATIWKWRPRR